MTKLNAQDLTAAQHRTLSSLIDQMESFFCNDSDRTDGMVYALDNGWHVHAIDCFHGTGATSDGFNRLYTKLVNSVGVKRWNTISRNEASEICDFARIQICSRCNSHAFTNPSDYEVSSCSDCLHVFPSMAS